MRAPALTSLAVLVALSGCSEPAPGDGTQDTGSASRPASGGSENASPPASLRARVLADLPHDRRAFTQGLEFGGPVLYEGTGLVGESSLTAGPPGKPPTKRTKLPSPLFGEGITLVDDRLWQLTWQNGIAIERDARTLAERRRVPYQGEGWGLCLDRTANRLIMSDGSNRLTFRDPRTFRKTGEVSVRRNGAPVDQLNELECTEDGAVYANVYQTDTIVRIDPRTGAVTAEIDASNLLSESERPGTKELNGIAAIPDTNEFLITGKLWPRMFRVEFVPR
jgi:glutamine cyclotransferase